MPASAGIWAPEGPARARARRLLLASLAAGTVAPMGLYALAGWLLRHRRYRIPKEDRARPRTGGGPPALTLRYLGITGYEVEGGGTTLLLDPTPTRPTLGELLSGPVHSDASLARLVCPRADYILVDHTHHDHILDVPAIAKATGAQVLGSRSSCNFVRSRGVPEHQVREVRPGDHLRLGSFAVDVRLSRHVHLFGSRRLMNGTMAPDAGPCWFWQFLQDGPLIFRLSCGGASLWYHPTSTYRDGDLKGGPPADTLIVGVTGEPLTVPKARGLLEESQARRVLPTHYDNFFQPIERGLALMPGLDMAAAKAAVRAGAPEATWTVLDYGERLEVGPDRPR